MSGNLRNLKDEQEKSRFEEATPQGAGGVGGLLATTIKQSNGTWKSYLPSYDGNGNIISWASDTGAILQRIDDDPFGSTLTKHGSFPDEEKLTFGFSTKYEDAETGLLYYGYRYYDPVTGRWPSRDPIEEGGGINLYAFVGNNAVDRLDVLGQYISGGYWPNGCSPSGIGEPNSWSEAFADLADWLKGNTPENTDYPCGHEKSKAISKSSIGKKLEEGYLKNFSDKPFKEWKDYTNVKLKFGPKEFIESIPNGTSHFVGFGRGDAYTIQIDEKKCEVKAKFVITNTTSLKSGLYHIIPNSWNNTDTGTLAANW